MVWTYHLQGNQPGRGLNEKNTALDVVSDGE